MRGALIALCLGLLVSCRSIDRNLVADAAASRIYHQCVYELLCVQDTSKWKCKVEPPPVRPVAAPGLCIALYNAEEELRWEAQIAEQARQGIGKLPPASRKALRAAKKKLDGLR